MKTNYMAVPGVWGTIERKHLLGMYTDDLDEILNVIRDICCEFFNVEIEKFHQTRTERMPKVGRQRGITIKDVKPRYMFCYIVKRDLFPDLTMRTISQYLINKKDHTLVIHNAGKFQDMLDTKEFDKEVYQMILGKIDEQLQILWLKRKS